MRLLVGTFGPRVPYVTTRNGVDQGPAGSLVQARERARVLRRASRPAAGRDRRLWVGGVVAVLAVVLLATGGVGGLVLGGLAAAVALALLYPRYRPDVLETELGRQIGRERELEPLRGLGWTVLHDRVLPDTEHRLAHVLAGPGGVLVVSVLPAVGPLLRHDDALWTGGAPLTDWFAARWWEVNRLHGALARRLSRWPWAGPVYPVVVLPEDRHSGLRRSGTGLVPAHAEVTIVTIRTAGQVRSWVAALPAPLGRLAAAELAAEVEAACPPAAVREPVLAKPAPWSGRGYRRVK